MKTSMRVVLVAAAVLLLIFEVISPDLTGDPTKNAMLETVLTRTVGAVLFLILIKTSGIRIFGITRNKRALLCILPAAAVAINNAPIIGLASGSAVVLGDSLDLILFTLQSITVGLFEETAFRGYLFPIILERSKERSVFFSAVVSSALFAAIHLVNLFSGASVGAVLLQVGYSFLIGGMCAIVLLKTRCIWVCAALHAVYNFGGTLIPTIGGGKVWDPITITVTAILGAAVLVIMLGILKNVTKEEALALCRTGEAGTAENQE